MLQKKSGDQAVKALKGSQLSKLLEADPEFDSDMQSSQDFLKAQGLDCLVG